jgi:hypothetical protein
VVEQLKQVLITLEIKVLQVHFLILLLSEEEQGDHIKIMVEQEVLVVVLEQKMLQEE